MDTDPPRPPRSAAAPLPAASEPPPPAATVTGGYHPLALDPHGEGGWGWVDQMTDRLANWLNPILIKEARQALKSRQFTITFFLLLLASWGWTVMGVILQSPGIYHVPSGTAMLVGYYFVLTIPLLSMVPLAAHRSLVAEIDDDTFEMLSITRLSALGIVLGKLNSAMLQMLVYFAALVPCLAFCYLLRGVALPTIGLLIATIFGAAILLTTASLLLATLAVNRAGQIFALLLVVGLVLLGEILCGAFCVGALLSENLRLNGESLAALTAFFLGGFSFVVLFVKAAAARIAPVTENRSSPLRWILFAQQLLWITVIATLAIYYEDAEPLNFGSMVVCGYWLLMGTLMLSESPYLSPRAHPHLPKTFFGRMMLTWFNPGPGTGFMFAISNGLVGIGILGMLGGLAGMASYSTFPLTFAAMSGGYLLGFLGLTRLLTLPLLSRFGRSLACPLVTLAALLVLAVLIPSVVTVVLTGSLASQYQLSEAFNWFWTLLAAFDNNLSPQIAVLILTVGLVILCINLGLLFREFRYRRIAVPARILAEEGRRRPAASAPAPAGPFDAPVV